MSDLKSKSDIKISQREHLEWWDYFYTGLEKGLSSAGRKYTRPKDWKQRAENNTRKPVRNQYEGRTGGSNNHE